MTQCSKNIDNKLIPLAKRYSEALLEIAKNKNELDEVYSELANVVELLNDSDNLKNFKEFLSHPVIPAEEKKDLLKSIFEGRLKEYTLNLLYILIEKNKINLLPVILYCFDEEMDEAKNILKVGVVSAVEMDSDSVSRLKEKLENKLHKSVKFVFEVNPDIIAGLILKINDKTIDGSMASKLQGFKKMLGN